MSRQVQNALVVIAVVLTSPIWVALLWSQLEPLGPSAWIVVGIVAVILVIFAVSRVRHYRRLSPVAEDGQGPGGAVDV